MLVKEGKQVRDREKKFSQIVSVPDSLLNDYRLKEFPSGYERTREKENPLETAYGSD